MLAAIQRNLQDGNSIKIENYGYEKNSIIDYDLYFIDFL